MAVTIKDIAEKMGISYGTVSMALNDKPQINEITRKNVKQTAKEMGYVVNQNAINLVKQQTNKVGLFLLSRPDFEGRITNFYFELLYELLEEANNQGYNIMLYTVNNDLEMKKSYKQLCGAEKLKGAIFIGLRTDDPHLKEISGIDDTTIITFDIDVGGNSNSVFTDNRPGIFEMFDYAKAKKMKKIAVITGHSYAYVTKLRLQAVNEYAKKNPDMNIDLFDGDYTLGCVKQSMSLILEKKYELIFAFNDAMALGAIEYCQDNQIKVPDEIAIVGFDNINICEHTFPKLASIAHSNSEIIKNFFAMINQSMVKEKRYLKSMFVKRASIKN